MTFTLFEAPVNPPDATASGEDGPKSVARAVADLYRSGLDRSIRDLEVLSSVAGSDYGTGYSPFDDVRQKLPSVNGLNVDVFRAIVANARELGLASPGSYRIDADDFESFLSGQNHRRGNDSKAKVTVDIHGLCEALEARFGGKAGELLEYRRAADMLIDTFSLRTAEIEVKAGIVELRQRKYLRKDYKGRYEFDYTDTNRLLDILGNLRIVFTNAGRCLYAFAFTDFLRGHERVVEPGRTIFDLTIDDQPLRIKVQKDHLRWRFPKSCADLLSDFVAEHGSSVEG